MNRLLLTFSLLLVSSGIYSQKKLLNDTVTLHNIKKGLYSMYYGDFETSGEVVELVRKDYPDHPVTSFLEGLHIYWKYFPLIPQKPASDKFIFLMEDCVAKAGKILEQDENDLEGVFFDLFGRAFYAMYWADNGKPGKVFPHLNNLYKNTVKGFELKDDFVEFYFTTGLYNYYIEAYPEQHPSFKPVALLFSGGDKEKGIRQLDYCAEKAVFLRVEAKLFLCLIYLNYEKDPEKASVYAAELYREFPKNEYYTGKYLEILLLNEKYFFAPVLLRHLEENNTPFSQMQFHLFRGILLEKRDQEYDLAAKEYEMSLTKADKFGDFATHHKAIAWMGLGRYWERNGKKDKAKEYYKMAKAATTYQYILKDH